MLKKKKIIPEVLYNESNKKAGIILKYKDYQNLIDDWEELYDILEYYKQKSKKYSTVSLDQVKKELFGSHAK